MTSPLRGLLAAPLLALVAALLAVGPALAAPDRAPSTLEVTGEGEARAAPDQAVVVLGVVSEAREAAAAQRDADGRMRAALERVLALGVEREQVRTGSIDLSPVYDHGHHGRGDRPQVTGYRARQTLEVRLDDPARVGPLVDAAVAAGLNEVASVRLELRDAAHAREEALRRAIADARARAAALAEALDLALGEVLEVQALDDAHGPRPFAEMRALAADAGPPVEPGLLAVGARVSVRWRLVPREGTSPR
ncbi:MAG: SIMPL domain-containing protein [Planctomycetes bacterium]|nr:SIMPL domain-containing protein [Planctomycetota bacterium]